MKELICKLGRKNKQYTNYIPHRHSDENGVEVFEKLFSAVEEREEIAAAHPFFFYFLKHAGLVNKDTECKKQKPQTTSDEIGISPSKIIAYNKSQHGAEKPDTG